MVAIAASAETQAHELAGYLRSLNGLRSQASEHERAIAAGDEVEAHRFTLNRLDLRHARALSAENRRSYLARYPSETVSDAPNISVADYARLREHLTDPLTVLKLTQSYAYQTCESPSWKTSKARTLCDAATATAAACMRGYGSRPWCI
ncbi:MAG TPA: hypothetical protein ENK57_19885 [Polyangiaceae bacterium]|nr:hypothetical protein [Polyangiaceae bacterium]